MPHRERAPVHNPSPSARVRPGQPKAFHSGAVAEEGKIVATRASSAEIARTGVTVRIPPALRSYTDGQDEVVLEADDVESLLRALDRAFPGIRDRVVDEAGRRRQYVNIFVNEELLWSSLPEARLRRGDVVHILPSVAGG